MYYPIVKAKRHELKALSELSNQVSAKQLRPVIEPVNIDLLPIVRTIEKLGDNYILPLVVVNPSQGAFKKASSSSVYSLLQSDSRSENKFLPCIKVRDASDFASINLATGYSSYALYFESDVSPAFMASIAKASCVLVNQQKVDPAIIDKMNSVVVYSDSFAKKKRNADYGESSFYSSLHVSYKQRSNAIGFGDFTILAEEYSESGGPAYVVAIHLSHINLAVPNSMYVRHFISTSNPKTVSNLPGKFKEALKSLYVYDSANPGIFQNTIGMAEYRELYKTLHFPGLGVIKEMSMKHHIQTLCAFI